MKHTEEQEQQTNKHGTLCLSVRLPLRCGVSAGERKDCERVQHHTASRGEEGQWCCSQLRGFPPGTHRTEKSPPLPPGCPL